MLDRGFMLPPAQFEAGFLSLAHTMEDMQSFATAAREVLDGLVRRRPDGADPPDLRPA